LDVIEGKLPRRALALVLEWANEHRDELMEDWSLVDVSALVNSPDPGIFLDLRDHSYFAQAYLDCGAVAWPNGADLAPETMCKAILDSGAWYVNDFE
ncbi:DUF4160 domain-containing protein, partial [bacterium]|nr:DUF4160 domain-containing protein [bacterium]